MQKFKQIYIIVLIFILAFSLRLVYLSQIKQSPLFYPATTGLDDALYYRWAQEISEGEWLGKEPFNAMPLYPYLLALIYKVFGSGILMPKIIQFVLGSLSCILIYLIAKKIFGNVSAIISALIACLYGPFIFYEEVLVATALTIFLYLLVFFSLLRAFEAPSWSRFFIFGLLAGISALTKSSILLFIPVLFILLILKQKAIKGAFFFMLSIGLGLFLAISPVTWRNYSVCNDFVPVAAHGGLNFYIGNNEDARGTFRTPKELGGTQQGLLVNSKIVAEKIKGKSLKASEVSQFWFSQGLQFVKVKPLKFVSLLAKKLLLFINFYEIPDVRDYRFTKQQFGILKMFFSFNIVFIFAVLGLILAKGPPLKTLLLKLFILMYVISVMLFFVNSRYRLPAVAFLIIFSGAGIYQYGKIVKKKAYKKALLCILPLLIVIGLGNMQLVRRDFSGSYNMMGLYYLERHDLPLAIAQFKKATEANPQMDSAHYNMGKAFMEAGDLQSALESFNQALKINPYLYETYNDKGNIYLSMNELDKAYAQFVRACELNPSYAPGHASLGLVYKKKEMWDLAIEEYRRALELNPDLAAGIYNNIGLVYYSRGLVEEAIFYFKKAIALEPNLVYAYYNLGLAFAKSEMFLYAKEQWEKAVALDPGFADAQERLNKLRELDY